MSRVYLLLLAFTITLAAVVGWRLPAQAVAVTLGVLAGVAASIPTSLVVAWIATRVALDRYAAQNPHMPAPSVSTSSEPSVIIVQAPSRPAAAPPIQTFAAESTGPRRFTILGASDDE